MREYFVTTGWDDDDSPTRVIHVRGCEKLEEVETPMRLGEHSSRLHAIEHAHCIFHEVKFCDECCA